jgi:arylsulfatase A-like enzyme
MTPVRSAILLLLSLHLAPNAPGEQGIRNVVLIHVDDLGWRDLGCMGSPVYETPHIDALAKEGMLFTNAYAAASLCTPARAGLLTGSQPTRHGIHTVVKNRGTPELGKVIPLPNNHYLPKGYPTIGTILSKAGIANSSVGKWHLSTNPLDHGFAEQAHGGYSGMPMNYFAPYDLPFLPGDAPDGKFLPECLREAGSAFLGRNRDKPFFLYFSTYLPHDRYTSEHDPNPLQAPEETVGKYRRKLKEMRKAKQDHQGHNNPFYAAMIEETDKSVGVILDKLRELELERNTLVIFISDNGGQIEYTSNLPLRGEKGSLYEAGIRVPFIVRMPGKIPPGTISHEPVTGFDLYPTICSAFGVDPLRPDEVDGSDLSPVLFEGGSLGERNLLWNQPSHWWPLKEQGPRSALRRGDWKLHHFYGDDSYELYNLADDIGESEDLSGKMPEVVARMKAELTKEYERFGAARTLRENPKYDEAASQAWLEANPPLPIPPKSSTQQAFKAIGWTATETPDP